ncbi:MAG: bile acid:sodium symporter family protein, partial [Planctomycetaceae bacterium]
LEDRAKRQATLDGSDPTPPMRAFLTKRWFLVSLALLIAGGIALGRAAAHEHWPERIDGRVPWLDDLFRPLPRIVTALVLFLMAFSLDTDRLKAALRSPGPVAWGSLVNYAVIPLLGWWLMRWQRSPDFQIGLMIAVSTPCTMAAASVWTRKAGGNDAVSLMVTLLTNAACFAVTPFWLNLATEQLAAGRRVELDVGEMMMRLLVTVLVPSLAGQALRQLPRPAALAARHKTPIGVVAQSLILVIVALAAFNAGQTLAATGTASAARPGAIGVGLVWGTCIGIHLAAMALAWGGARLAGFRREDAIAVAFAGSQKTLPIGVLLATDPAMFGDPNLLGMGFGVPFAVFPMLMYHASQLFLDTAVADRFAARTTDPPLAA